MLDLWRRFHRLAAIAFVVALLVTLAPATPAEAATRSVRIPVLMYHRIGSYASRYQVTQTAFAQQLNWLRANGYTVVSINRVCNYMESIKKPGVSHPELHAGDCEGLSESSGRVESAAAKRVHDAVTLSDSPFGAPVGP